MVENLLKGELIFLMLFCFDSTKQMRQDGAHEIRQRVANLCLINHNFKIS